jgi:hypothetical protein
MAVPNLSRSNPRSKIITARLQSYRLDGDPQFVIEVAISRKVVPFPRPTRIGLKRKGARR